MTGVKQYSVNRRVNHVMNSDREFHDTEIRTEIASSARTSRMSISRISGHFFALGPGPALSAWIGLSPC
jgi:hypothetical protein